MSIQRLVDQRCHTGEGPLWHPEDNLLYWVDIPNGLLFSYDPETEEHAVVHETDVIGGFTIQSDGSLLLFEDSGTVERLHDGVTETIVDSIPRERMSRFNDVIADPLGGVFCGTMPTDEQHGRLYRLDTDGSLTTVLPEVGLPNGLGFSPDREKLYFTDSTAGLIYRFEYDGETGELSGREVFVDVSTESGVPDGLTVDQDGYVWSARWNGGCVVRYAPDGTERRRISFPAKKVSALTFGGPEYDTAYVTTALTESSRAEEGPGAGALFRFDPGIRGKREFTSSVFP